MRLSKTFAGEVLSVSSMPVCSLKSKRASEVSTCFRLHLFFPFCLSRSLSLSIYTAPSYVYICSFLMLGSYSPEQCLRELWGSYIRGGGAYELASLQVPCSHGFLRTFVPKISEPVRGHSRQGLCAFLISIVFSPVLLCGWQVCVSDHPPQSLSTVATVLWLSLFEASARFCSTLLSMRQRAMPSSCYNWGLCRQVMYFMHCLVHGVIPLFPAQLF